MTMTNEHVPGPLVRRWHDAMAEDLAKADHRRQLRLVAAGGLALAFGLSVGLAAAWQVDRWLNDWHYGLTPGFTAPGHLAEPGLPIDPSAYVVPGEAA